MAKQSRGEIIVGLDIGTTKITCLVGEVTPQGVDLIGLGTHPSHGLKKGVVVNIDSTVQSIEKAVEEAENMAGVEIGSVYAGIAGSHIMAFNSEGMVAIKDKEVSQNDIDRVIEAAKAINIPQDRELLHVIPQEFSVDEQDGIREPIGMAGVRLEARVHVVTAAVTSAQNIIKCCTRCHLQVEDIVLEPLASAEAVLQKDEKELGVALLDIGGGTSDLVIYNDGAIVHTAVIPIGGSQLTNDLAIGLRTPVLEAEQIKQKYGCCFSPLVKPEETIEVLSVGGRPPRVLPRQLICDVLEPRTEEIFLLAQREIRKSGYEETLASGLVITGGSTILQGMPELAEQVLNIPVRRGSPLGIGGLTEIVQSPIYATGVGLLLYAAKQHEGSYSALNEEKASIWQRMREWFREAF